MKDAKKVKIVSGSIFSSGRGGIKSGV